MTKGYGSLLEVRDRWSLYDVLDAHEAIAVDAWFKGQLLEEFVSNVR